MNHISLCQTLPEVFATLNDIQSQVWQQDLSFERGKTYLVEANSGTGKSSLCSYIYGYRHDYRGKILFDDRDISSLSTRDWVKVRQRHISLLWQELRLFPELSALENVQIKNRLTGFQTDKTIDEWFDRLGIADRQHAKIGRMSFGQQQRVAMIRALCQPYDFIFVDEPVSHLDEDNSRIMADMLVEESKRQGAGIVATSIGKRIDLKYDMELKL